MALRTNKDDVLFVFRLGQRRLTLNYKRVPFQSWGELQQAAGFTRKTLLSGVDDLDVGAIVAVIWLERTQRERKLRYQEVYAELQAEEYDEEFEVLDVVYNGRSLSGEPTAPGEYEDPTAGS